MAADHRPTRETDILAGVRCMLGGDRSTQARILGDRRRHTWWIPVAVLAKD